MKKHFTFSKVFLFFNSVAATMLLLSYLAGHVSPNTVWVLALFGLAYPFLLVVNLVFLLVWLLRKSKRYRYSLIAILIGWGTFWNVFQCNTTTTHENEFKVMSYNVRLFDLYNWTDNWQTRNRIFDMLNTQSPDIICFQEFFHSDQKTYFTTLDTLVKFQKAKNVHTHFNSAVGQVHHFGLATFSKYPIIHKGVVDLKKDYVSNNDCIYTDVKIDEDTLRVYNMHLASIHFGNDDYKFIEEINDRETAEQIEGSKRILKRLRIAFQRRAAQVEIIAQHIQKSPYPTVVCVDLNDAPASYAYNVLTDQLEDAFVERGNGAGTTYNGMFPAFRIDYILNNEGVDILNYKTIKRPYSDHFPITATAILE